MREKQFVEALFNSQDEKLLRAFLESVYALRDTIPLNTVIARLERGDINGAMLAMNLDADAYSRFELALAEAYNAGGAGEANNLPMIKGPDGARVVFRWGVRNPEAEAWLTQHSSTLVTRIVEDQRVAIRTALAEGMAQGSNPRETALAVVGRTNRVNGRREGGIIGVTSAQERYIANARRELLSGDKEDLRNYLTRERRDKRFDSQVKRALLQGKPLPKEAVEKIVARYSDRLLALRGEMLARTETMMAIGQSRNDAIQQQIANGKLMAEDVTKIWRATNDGRTRHSHMALNGTQVAMGDYFQTPSGATLLFPGDPNGPTSEVVGCRCWLEYKIDYIGQVVRRQRAA